MYKIFSLGIKIARALENFFQFIAVIILFYMLLYALYMLFVLAGSSAFNFFEPIASFITSISTIIWSGKSAENGGMIVKEFITGILLIVSLFFIAQFIKNQMNNLAKLLNDLQISYREHEDIKLNKKLHNDIKKMNKKLSACMIYTELKIKNGICAEVNLDEQYKLLNNFLYSKTGILPEKYIHGYVYKISNIEKIDRELTYFFKAINSKAPVDYMFILQVEDTAQSDVYFEIKKLIEAGIYNKIIMTPATRLRYEHNQTKSYNTGVIGNYTFAGEMYSIYELREKVF